MKTAKQLPNDISEPQMNALVFMADPANLRAPHIKDLKEYLKHRNRASAWRLVQRLVENGYLENDCRPSRKAIALLRKQGITFNNNRRVK